MQRITIILGMVLAGLVTSQWLMGQSRQKQQARARQYIEDFKKRPDLGVDYARVAKFKLGSRKTTYSVGEMITVDLAIMNVSNMPVFFHELNRPTLMLEAHGEKGTDASIEYYTTALEGTSPKSYQQIGQGHLLLASFQLLAGCTSDLDAFLEEKHKFTSEEFGHGEAAYFKGLFERDLFVNWGKACFSTKIPGRYTITAEQSNDTVLVSPNRPSVKTAMGRIRSSPLTLTIVE